LNGLQLLERLIENGDATTIVQLGERTGADRMAADLWQADAQVRSEFDRVEALSAYLRSLAAGQVADARRAIDDPTRVPQLSTFPTAAAALHAMTASAAPTVSPRVPLATVPHPPSMRGTTATPPSPAPPVPAAPRRAASPATLTLEEAGRMLRLGRVEDLPRTSRLREVFRQRGLLVDADSPDWQLDRAAVDRLAAQPAQCDAMFLHLLQSTPSLCFAGGGGDLQFRS